MYFNDLLNVSKPARYLGGEMNSIVKVDSSDLLKFCLIFPDIYEIGSSHVGFRLLYELVNMSDKISCERFFAPWVDAKDKLGAEIFKSLENGKSLKDFDVLGFSIHYEMSYTAVLSIIKMSGLAFRTVDRKETDPIIIAGGSCMYNPAPLKPFIDVFYIGEGDKGLTEILEDIKGMKDKNLSKNDILKCLNDKYSFLYVPSADDSKAVKRDIFLDFGKPSKAVNPIVPLMPAIQDRVAIEIARGCTGGCRFCQAGMIYRPVRERDTGVIIDEAVKEINSTGHLEVSLLSLSTGDYSELPPLVRELNNRLENMHVSLSTPSLRADSVSGELFKELSKVRKSGFTIAPEAGNDKMRRAINKNLSEEEIIGAVEAAASNDYTSAKLYFMIGLPYETDEDILAIASLATKIKSAAAKIKRGFDVSVAVSHFVPKPHTPFEIYGQVARSELERRMYMLKDELKRRKLKFKFHDTRMSTAEAFLSRGDSVDSAKFLEHAVNSGAYLEAWDDFFRFDNWLKWGEECGVDIEANAVKSYDEHKDTPWANIETGVSEKFFARERLKAQNLETTPDCRMENCSACGVCDFKEIDIVKANVTNPSVNIINERSQNVYDKYLITYSKTEEAKFLSALELSRIFSHVFRVSGGDLKFSEGFNPLPRIVMYQPLPVGMSGENEKVVIEAFIGNIQTFIVNLNKYLPKGLWVKDIEKADTLKIGSDFLSSYSLDNVSNDIVKKAIETENAFYTRLDKKGNPKTITLSEYLYDYKDNIITLKANALGGFNLFELLKKYSIELTNIDIKRINVDMLGQND